MPDPRIYLQNSTGIKVDRDTDTLPQTAQDDIFVITGGRVLLKGLVGIVTTVIGATASNLKVTSNPTVGADVDIAANVAIANDPVGTMYTLPAAFATALSKGNAVIMPAVEGIILSPGTLDIITSGSTSGAIQWSALYVPFDAEGRMEAGAL